jgi:hypothetical protein
MVTLIVPWYRSKSERHNSELLGALFSNLSAPGVTRVLLATEGAPPPVSHPLLEIVECKTRPTFWELFELVRDEGPFAILNADCSIVDARYVAELGPRQCLWITRWGVHHGKPGNGRYYLDGGADCFAFGAVPDDLPRSDVAPGQSYCDRVIGRELSEAGYELRNLPWAVPIIHFHAERIEAEDNDRPSFGLYTEFFVRPTGEHRSDKWVEPYVERSSV